ALRKPHPDPVHLMSDKEFPPVQKDPDSAKYCRNEMQIQEPSGIVYPGFPCWYWPNSDCKKHFAHVLKEHRFFPFQQWCFQTWVHRDWMRSRGSPPAAASSPP